MKKITPQDIIFLIPTCTKYSDKTNAIRETWAKQLKVLGFQYLFLMGRPKLHDPKIEGDILYVPCKDDYESLLLKLVLGYRFLYQEIDFTYVYKIDDDCYPNLKKLVEKILPQLEKKNYLGGAIHSIGEKMNDKWHFGKCSSPKFDQPYKYDEVPFPYAYGGYGYFLNKDILPILFQKEALLRSELDQHIYSYEDVRVAEILDAHGITVSPLEGYSKISGFHYNNSDHYLIYDIQNPDLMRLVERHRSFLEEQPSVQHSYLNHYFDHIYVVNLKRNATNRLKITKHLREHGVDFELFTATDGYTGKVLKHYTAYQNRKLGDLKRYPHYSDAEIERGHAFISSAGAMGYIYTYLEILRDAKKKNHKTFLILEDDILLSKNFEKEFRQFTQNIGENWKLLLLGASQYGWGNTDIKIAKQNSFYHPISVDTCGSFAIALHSDILDELMEAQSAFEAPFDHLPIGEIYEKYPEQCFVAYPNIVIPDVSDSSIRGKRSQQEHSKLMLWEMRRFDYPLDKPSISILVTDKNNLKYFESFSKVSHLPFDLRLYFNSADGIRPLHSTELLNVEMNTILPEVELLRSFESDYLVTLEREAVLSESDILRYIEYKLGLRKKNRTPLKERRLFQMEIKKDRVSVIIPTYKRAQNLKNALASAVMQDYPDIEVIVVSDNGSDTSHNKETRQIVHTFAKENPNCVVVLLEHYINRNGAAARNTGILNSTGRYICFLDDDDIYLQGRLSKSVAKLNTTDKTTGAVYCGFIGWNSSENDLERYKSGDLTREILLLDFKKHYLCSNTATYKREAVFSINGFDESFYRHQDLEFNLRFFERYKIEVLKEILVQLNPEPSTTENKVYNFQMLKVKQKFLNQFSYMIESFDDEVKKSIYMAHWSETKAFVSDKGALAHQLSNNPKEGLIHILEVSENIKTIREQEIKLKEYRDSASYRLGHLLLHETRTLKNIFNLQSKIREIKKSRLIGK